MGISKRIYHQQVIERPPRRRGPSMGPDRVNFTIDKKEFNEALRKLNNMHDSLDPDYLKQAQARVARRTIEPAMRRRSKSSRIDMMIGVTTAKKKTPPLGIRVGVIHNDPALFPDFSAPATASVIEYGTAERFRNMKALGFITGDQSTGEMPSKPFLRPGWDSSVQQFMNEVESIIEERVMKSL